MTSIIEVMQAVEARAEPALPEWNTFWDEPAQIPFDAFALRPDPGKFADYQQVNSSYTKWYLWMALYVRADDVEAARTKIGALTDPRGPLIARLCDVDRDIEDRLDALCRGHVEVTTGRSWALRSQRGRFGDTRYAYAELGLVCGAN